MKPTEELAAKIERLIHDHVAELHRLAADAVKQSFAQVTAPTGRKKPRSTPTTAPKRPASAELTVFAERLHGKVCETPGESMAVLAERLGSTVTKLRRPMENLRRTGRVRTIGSYGQMRYFPTVARPAKTS